MKSKQINKKYKQDNLTDKTLVEANVTSPSVLICECSSREHQIIIEPDLEDDLLYCHIHLIKYGFWKRLKAGVRYIFGYKSRYGHWDEFIFKPEHADKLREYYEFLLKK